MFSPLKKHRKMRNHLPMLAFPHLNMSDGNLQIPIPRIGLFKSSLTLSALLLDLKHALVDTLPEILEKSLSQAFLKSLGLFKDLSTRYHNHLFG